MRAHRHLLPLALLLGCTPSPEKQAEIGRDLSKEYAQSACRFYTDDSCLANMSDSCGGTISFESMGDCESFFSWAFMACSDDVYAALWEMEDAVTGCIDQMDAWDCGGDPLCTDDVFTVFEGGDCADMNDLMEDHCEGPDTGW